MSQQHVRLVLLGLVLLCASLGRAALSDERGLFYGNPTSGSVQFAGLSSGGQSYFAETHVSHPTAVALHENLVYFANIEPLSKQPWISYAPVSGDEKATLFSQDDTPSGMVISALAIDSDYQSGSLFFLYRDIEQNRESQDSLDVIFTQALDTSSGATAAVVYTMTNGTAPPNSIALDTANQMIYFSSNGLMDATKSQRSLGGIYKVPYAGGQAEQVLALPQLAETSTSIASLKFYDNHLYYILNTVSDRTIRKVDVTDPSKNEVICDSLSFAPMEIELDVSNDQVTLWIRDSQGKFYRASATSCAPAVSFTLPHVLDFVFEANSKTFFSVNSDVAAVLSYGTTAQPSAIVSGIGEDTNIWVDSANRVLYYSTYNRIDSFTIEDTPSWSVVYKLAAPDSVEDLTGDQLTGNLIIATKNAVVSWSPREQEVVPLLPVHATSITVVNSTLYYGTNVSDTYSVMRCNLDGCSTSTAQSVVSGVAKSIDTVSVANDGTIFYGTTDGLFQTSDNTVVVPYLATISPFAMVLRSKQLTYLDVNGNQVIVGTCDIDNCRATLNISTAEFNPTTRVEFYAFMEIDPRGMVYWTTSLAPGVIYHFDSTNATANITKVWGNLPENRVRGMSISEDGSSLYVSLGTDARIFPTNQFGQGGQVCVTGENVTVSALEVYASSLFWSDSRTGNVFQCNSDCNNCFASSFVNNIASKACVGWQTLAVQKKLMYEQSGCGGIVRVAYNSTQAQVQTLRTAGQYPYTDMVTGDMGLLAFAVPFRATIKRATAAATALQHGRTVLTGTGLFTDLVVDQSSGSNTYYWNDPASRKLLKSVDGSVSDLTLEFALGLSSYVPTSFPSRSPSPSISVQPSSVPSVSASVSISASASASVSGSASASASVSSSGSAATSASMSSSMSPSGTVTLSSGSSLSSSISVSLSSSASGSVTMTSSASPSSVPTMVNETSATPSASASASWGAMASVTPSPSFLPFLNNSASNTPGLANMTEPVVSPLISTTGWEWISLISFFLIVCVILPCSYCTWKNNVEQEMAMSLRLP